jgi:hypothetical protein
MAESKCNHCDAIGHFASYCHLFRCKYCKKYALKHYPNDCHKKNVPPTPPPTYEQTDSFYDAAPEEFDYNFDNDAIANMTGEPVGDY